jgi:hypothetical protein
MSLNIVSAGQSVFVGHGQWECGNKSNDRFSQRLETLPSRIPRISRRPESDGHEVRPEAAWC